MEIHYLWGGSCLYLLYIFLNIPIPQTVERHYVGLYFDERSAEEIQVIVNEMTKRRLFSADKFNGSIEFIKNGSSEIHDFTAMEPTYLTDFGVELVQRGSLSGSVLDFQPNLKIIALASLTPDFEKIHLNFLEEEKHFVSSVQRIDEGFSVIEEL